MIILLNTMRKRKLRAEANALVEKQRSERPVDVVAEIDRARKKKEFEQQAKMNVETGAPLQQKDSMTKMATFAKAAYFKDNATRQRYVDARLPDSGYVIDNTVSGPYSSVFVNSTTKNVITSFRGTDPRNLRDLKSDALIAAGLSDLDERMRTSTHYQQSIMKRYPDYSFSLASHSLGGTINKYVSRDLGVNNFEEIHNFNRGSGLGDLSENITRANTNMWKRANNVYDYRVEGDVISLLRSRSPGDITIKKQKTQDSAHTINQFI